MESQIILNGYQNIEEILQDEQVKKCFVVHGHSFEKKEAFSYLKDTAQQQGVQLVQFSGYTSNPKVEEVQAGVELFNKEKCDFLIAVGGGSAIDVAKCIKQRINGHSQGICTDHTGNEKTDADYGERKAYVKMLAIPTTAGTGSESTQFAVVYENGEKKSVDDADILPEYVILDADLLKGLPVYQRKATMLDALCQAIESIWAKKATQESQRLATEAIQIIVNCYHDYLNDIPEGNEKMIKAANLAGQAINVTRTTAAHAMSYKITSLYGAAHGHAVGACMKVLWKWMLEQYDIQSIDEKLKQAYEGIKKAFGVNDIQNAYEMYVKLFDELELVIEGKATAEQMDTLVSSVNVQRLSNHPIELTKDNLREIYEQIMSA